MENQLDSVTEKPTFFLRLQGLACDWSKHNKHSRNIFSVHGSLRLSVRGEYQAKLEFPPGLGSKQKTFCRGGGGGRI